MGGSLLQTSKRSTEFRLAACRASQATCRRNPAGRKPELHAVSPREFLSKDTAGFINHPFFNTESAQPERVRLGAPPGPLAFGVMARVELHLLDSAFQRPLPHQVFDESFV